MIDTHLHIGRYKEVHYETAEVFSVVQEAGVDGGMYSSTTSADRGIRYGQVEREIAGAAKRWPPERFFPLLWFIPPYIAEGLTVERAFAALPYGGIKLHPRAHRWRLSERKHAACLHGLFGFANERDLPVLIHTGPDAFERPAFFERFFAPYPNAKIILAHSRPAEDALALFRRYPHILGDTAFLDDDSFRLIRDTGFADRLLPGTDFPITHYYRASPSITLKGQYEIDIAQAAFSFCDSHHEKLTVTF